MYIIYVNHDSVIKQICQLRDKAFLINETKFILQSKTAAKWVPYDCFTALPSGN